MSLEAAAIILALLWGPTALWLIFRAVRGPTGGTRESFAREPARRRTATGPLEAVIRNEYWICKDCRSVNHLGAMHCYACGIKRPPPEPVAPEPAFTDYGWVGVMDPAVARRTTEPVSVTRLQPTASVLPPDPPAAPAMPELIPEPAMVAGAASRAKKSPRTPRRSPTPARAATAAELSVAAHMTEVPPAAVEPAANAPELSPDAAMVAAGAAGVSRATKRPRAPRRPRAPAGGATAAEQPVAADMTTASPAAIAPAALAPAAPEPAPQLPPVTPSIAPPVCPYLGFEDDPATQCSYPDSRNVCHAAAANRGPSLPSPRRLVRGGRTLAISADHQATLCLTSEHQQCDRYPAAQSSARPSQGRARSL